VSTAEATAPAMSAASSSTWSFRMYPLGVDSRPVYAVAADLDAPSWPWQRRVIVDAYGASAALFCTAASDKQQGDNSKPHHWSPPTYRTTVQRFHQLGATC
jgi:hypothetical protein